jgi:putative ABC transport system substrate-binding protein
MGADMQRRDFLGDLGGAAAWPLTARAQQPDRVRRIGVQTSFDENDPVAKTYLSEFVKGLGELGWSDGRNVRMDVRWAGSVDRARMHAKELVDLQPDVILSGSTPQTAAFQRETDGSEKNIIAQVRGLRLPCLI